MLLDAYDAERLKRIKMKLPEQPRRFLRLGNDGHQYHKRPYRRIVLHQSIP